MGFQLGPFFIHYYGVIIMSGALFAAFLTAYEAKRRGENPEFVWDALSIVLIGGVIGARIWHILTPPPSMVAQGITTLFYLTHPLDALAIWRGGLGIPGAVIGGTLALYWFARRRKLNFSLWIDLVVPGLALGQAIGRWGNFVNQELYGRPTDLPWAISIDLQHRLPGFETFERFHPLFLYESLWNLGNMFLLLWLSRKQAGKLRNGDLALLYLIVYPVGRFLLEFLRLDSAEIAGLNANQTFMAIVALVAAGVLIYRHRQPVQPEAEVAVIEPVGNEPDDKAFIELEDESFDEEPLEIEDSGGME
ncbi:MAG TPA: prolipoprotein diacylglyceryl transferase [Anaerolineales bacterium]|nr:prolipoprotein diacylglyceryl transferase [Anaerolineales bacterium]